MRIQQASEVEPSFFESREAGDATQTVQKVIECVRQKGDEAIKEYAAKFDDASPAAFEIEQGVLKAAADKMKKENAPLYDALIKARNNAARFAQRQRRSMDDWEWEMEDGLFAGQKNIPVERAGVYVPAGRHPLVSTVVMTVVPALVAGVKEIVLCTPPKANRDGSNAPYADESIMAAAWICGGEDTSVKDTSVRVFACGGAQAIAAMAYGTQSIPACDVIVGPGNKFVAEAKRQVYGKVGIDMIAGPTEVFIIADKNANPVWVAADLLAQAEHDVVAQSILVTVDKDFAQKVSDEADKQLATLPTRDVAQKSIESYGRIIIAKSFDEAASIANRKAPEHLEIAMAGGKERDIVLGTVRNYGSLFIGGEAAEVLGDYSAGINHTLPTSGCARYTGGLSVRSFTKTVTTLRAEKGKKGLENAAMTASVLGEAEGLCAHARAARLRTGL